jgi:hypothetical protein
VAELEPGITQTENVCACDKPAKTCQAPQYYHGSVALSMVDGGFGLDAYEPAFQLSRPDWLASRFAEGEEGYRVKLNLTDADYDKDLFYFWCAAASPAPRAPLAGQRLA